MRFINFLLQDFSLQNVVDNMAGMDLEDDPHDDVLPQAAQDMGTGGWWIGWLIN